MKCEARTEDEMREIESAWPKTEDEFISYIRSLVERDHDYGTVAYAMSLAAVAAFNYIAIELGGTGFQAGYANMDATRRLFGFKGPFGIVDASKMLYPQYDITADIGRWTNNWQQWAADEATKLLANNDTHGGAVPRVVAHWKKLAAYAPPAAGTNKD